MNIYFEVVYVFYSSQYILSSILWNLSKETKLWMFNFLSVFLYTFVKYIIFLSVFLRLHLNGNYKQFHELLSLNKLRDFISFWSVELCWTRPVLYWRYLVLLSVIKLKQQFAPPSPHCILQKERIFEVLCKVQLFSIALHSISGESDIPEISTEVLLPAELVRYVLFSKHKTNKPLVQLNFCVSLS